MSHYLIEQIEAIDTIAVRTATVVEKAHGDEHLESLTLHCAQTGVTEQVEASHLFVFIGAAPRTDWLGEAVVRDAYGFVCTGPDLLVEGGRPPGWPLDRDPLYLESSVPGVFVAGDVRAESVKRVASAVGEGAMAVTLVHRYLEEAMSTSLTPEELRGLFLFEHLDRRAAGLGPRQLEGRAVPGGRHGHGRGRAGDLLLRAAVRDDVDEPAGRRRGRGDHPQRPASAPTAAPPSSYVEGPAVSSTPRR